MFESTYILPVQQQFWGNQQGRSTLHDLIRIVDENNKPINLMGAPFDFVMRVFGGFAKMAKEVDLVCFFRGTKDELKAACSRDGMMDAVNPKTVTTRTIVKKGPPEKNV